MGKDTEEMLAIRYPNSYHLFPKLEKTCKLIKAENDGKADVHFSAQGIDHYGKLIVKYFKLGIHIFINDKDNEPSN